MRPTRWPQLIYVQEEAIKSLNQQLEEAKRQSASSQSSGGGGGFLSSIFGGGGSQRPPEPQQRPGGAWGGQQPGYAPQQGYPQQGGYPPQQGGYPQQGGPWAGQQGARPVAAASSPPRCRWRQAAAGGMLLGSASKRLRGRSLVARQRRFGGARRRR